jgi:hypothetical protein
LDRQHKTQETLPSEVQWYVLIGEQQYGPLPFSHLAQFAAQGRLLKDNWIWRPGFSSWTAAGDVPGIFAGLARSPDEPAQRNRAASNANETPAQRRNLKQRASEEIKNFSLIFLYLWVVFGMLAIHESIILAQHKISYISHGFAFVNALIFAKVMLLAQDFHLGHRLDDKPLVYSILFKSLLFGVTLICFHIVEHVLIGMWHAKPLTETISEIGVDNLEGLVSIGIITTVALVPFFILREISRVIGEGKLWRAALGRRGRGLGIVCAGDILTVTTDRKWLSFMRSYPNFIPLSAHTVEHIGAVLKPFAFETIYGHYFDRVIANDAKTVLETSVARYVASIEGKRGYE